MRIGKSFMLEAFQTYRTSRQDLSDPPDSPIPQDPLDLTSKKIREDYRKMTETDRSKKQTEGRVTRLTKGITRHW